MPRHAVHLADVLRAVARLPRQAWADAAQVLGYDWLNPAAPAQAVFEPAAPLAPPGSSRPPMPLPPPPPPAEDTRRTASACDGNGAGKGRENGGLSGAFSNPAQDTDYNVTLTLSDGTSTISPR